jgi:hypothetical protein
MFMATPFPIWPGTRSFDGQLVKVPGVDSEWAAFL